MNKKLILLIATIAIIISVALALIVHQATIRNIGKITTIGCDAYWDYQTTQSCRQIDWGKLEPNETNTTLIYIKSTGNTNTTLIYSTSDWNPENASAYIILTWNYKNQTIQPNEVIPVTLILHINQDTYTYTPTFEFNITITAVEVE